MSSKRLWFVVGALGVVVTLVLGWFLLVGPLIEGGLQAEVEARQTETSNADLEAQIAILAKEYEAIDDLRDELGEMLGSIPGRLDLAALIRQLDVAQAVSGARIVSLTPGDATPYVPAVPQVVTPQPTTEEPASGEETATSDEAAATEAPVVAGGSAGLAPADPSDTLALSSAGLVLVPIDLQVSGSPEQLLAFAAALQRMSRLFLVTAVEAVGGDAPGGSINGFVYVLPQAVILPPEPEPIAPTPTPTPASSGVPTPSPSPTP